MADTRWYCRGSITPGTGAGTSGDPAHILDFLGPAPTLSLGDGDIIFCDYTTVYSLSGANKLTTPYFPSNTKPIMVVATDASWNVVGPDNPFVMDGTSLNAGLNVLTVDDPWWIFMNFEIRNGPQYGLYCVTGDGCSFIGGRIHSNSSDGINVANGSDWHFFHDVRSYNNGGVGYSGNSSNILPFSSCAFYGNSGVQCFEKSTITTTIPTALINCVVAVEGAITNPAITAGNLLLINTDVVSSATTAPTDALLYPSHRAIFFDSLIRARVAGVTALKNNTANVDVASAGNIFSNFSTVYGTNITVKVDGDGGSPVTTDPEFTSVPNDMTPAADLSGVAMYPAVTAEAGERIPGAVQSGGGGGSIFGSLIQV